MSPPRKNRNATARKARKKRRRGRFFIKVPRTPEDGQLCLFEDVDLKPRLVQRPQHCISRKNIDREALKVLYRLKDHGYLAYLVGGSVRDLLLGKTPKDFDIGTDATPEEIRRLFRYSRIIGKRFRLVHVYFKGGKIIEVSTFRKQIELDDREAAREGLGAENIFGSPREDAFRRDLTINGLFYNIADFGIIDFVGGMDDLKKGIIRTIGDPERRFIRDPVRMLRTIRHAARTGFSIEGATWDAVCRHAGKIKLCAVPRVRDEWLKDLKSGFSAVWSRYLIDSGLFQEMFPFLKPFLTGPDSEALKGLVQKVLSRVDQMTREGRQFSDAFYLSALALPFLHFMPDWHELRPDKVRWPTYEVRGILDSMFVPYEFKRGDRDLMAQLISSHWPVKFCAGRNRWQKRVYSKATFPEALELYNCLQAALNKEEINLHEVQKLPKKKAGHGKRRGRRRHRKNIKPDSEGRAS